MMITLIFKTGTLLEKLEKCRIIDNMRTEIEKKVLQGVEFSNEAFLALAAFPKSEIETLFGIKDGQIVGCVEKSQAANISFLNAGYAIPTFYQSEIKDEKEWVCYCISPYELEKIGWTDTKEIPSFVTEVFEKLNCMPDEIIND